MKKAQILSAIALAFALGVVVPVAGVVNNAAYAAEYKDVTVRDKKEATGTEVAAAIAYVQANKTYDKIAKVAATIAEYTSVAVPAADTNTTIQGKMTALNGQFVNGVEGDKIVASYSNTDDLSQLAQKATQTTNYALYSNLVKDIVNANAADFSIATAKSDIQAMNAKGITNINVSAWGTTIKTQAEVIAALKTTTDYDKVANYTNYKALVDAVNTVTDYNTAFDAIKNAIEAAGLTEAGQTALKSVVDKKYDTTDGTIAKLSAVAADANIKGYTAWEDVYNAIEDADGYSVKASADNYNKVKAIADAWVIALPDNDNSADVVAEVMMGYKATDGTGEGENKPGDDEKDPSAPDTGILANTEGSASTTLAMVAGIATALTAAGAGVVAYRNARRANK